MEQNSLEKGALRLINENWILATGAPARQNFEAGDFELFVKKINRLVINYFVFENVNVENRKNVDIREKYKELTLGWIVMTGFGIFEFIYSQIWSLLRTILVASRELEGSFDNWGPHDKSIFERKR